MRIWYLLESTELCGGVRVVFDQARALQKRGHAVSIRALRGDHAWYPYPISVEYVSRLEDGGGRHAPDIVVATFWTTVRPALELKRGRTFHLCQGYEGDFAEYAALRPEIESAYRLPVHKITIGRWLNELLEQHFGKDGFKTFCVGQIVDTELFYPIQAWRRLLRRTEQGQKIKIVLAGLFESSFKGIPYALEAVFLIRARGTGVHLIRISPGRPSEVEQGITQIDEYHSHISPLDVAEIFRRSDLYLAPSLSQEGFGLPLAEALACGIPSVATSIPSYLGFDEKHDYACFVPEKDPAAMAEAALRVICDGDLQKRLRVRGLKVVRNRFRSETVAEKLEKVFVGAAYD